MALGLTFCLRDARAATPNAGLVGILGDMHGDVAHAFVAVQQLKRRGVTDLILTGDLVGFDESNPYYADFHRFNQLDLEARSIKRRLQAAAEKQMTDLLEAVQAQGFARDHVYLMPGNWEKMWAPDYHAIFPKYGHVINYNYDGKGVITLGGKNIMVSHYPKIPIPAKYLPPGFNDPFMEAGMSSMGYPGSHVDLIVFAHTHKRAAYRDEKTGAWVLNPGSITAEHQTTNEPSYAIYDPKKNWIEIRGLNQNLLEAHSIATIDCLNKEIPSVLSHHQ